MFGKKMSAIIEFNFPIIEGKVVSMESRIRL